jgi:hypothetical protein
MSVDKLEDDYMCDICKPHGLKYMREKICNSCRFYRLNCKGCPEPCKSFEEILEHLKNENV